MGIHCKNFNEGDWEEKMQRKLVQFYLNCFLPELVDPRHTRKLQIRELSYILQAQQDKLKPNLIKKFVRRKLIL